MCCILVGLNNLDEIESKMESLPKTKRYDIDDNVIDIENYSFYSITQQDCDEAKAEFQKWCRENPNESRFPVHLFCAIGNKKAGQVALLNTSWHGTINLNNAEERKHFERHLDYESSEIQQKNKNK